MADWSKPALTDTKANLVDYIKARDTDAFSMADTRGATPTSIPDYAKRWNDTNKQWEYYHSGAWQPITLGIVGGGTGGATASAARTALGLDTAYAHPSEPNVHSATSSATGSRIIIRDANGRAQIVAPSAAADIVNYGTLTTHQNATTGVHGATGTIVDSSSVQTLTNKTLGSGCKLTPRWARVYNSTTQAISDATWTVLTFNSEVADTDNLHSTVSNTSRMTIPAGITKVRFTGQVLFAADGTQTGARIARILRNGSAWVAQSQSLPNGVDYDGLNLTSGIYVVSSSDYFELQVYQNSGTGRNVFGGNTYTWFLAEIVE